ncbi:MAG: 50S ribosomal protein L11 methyltransferase [Myxococcota bacterium]
MGDEYRRFWIASSTALARERLLAEAFEAGAAGAEERDEPLEAGGDARFRACVYAPADAVEALRSALVALAEEGDARAALEPDPPAEPGATARGRSVRIGPVEPVEAVDWSEAWKAGLGPIEISPRLVVRPPFAAVEPRAGRCEIVIEPGQAFGTGTHASTRLCLEWIDRLVGASVSGAPVERVLDVGTGSGVLALAAVALGARAAVGFDLDPVAIEAASVAARENRLEASVRLVCAPIEAIEREPAFDLILANLLKRELLPIAEAIAARLGDAGSLVLAGLLEEDGGEVAARFAPLGLVEVERRVRDDAVGRWIAPRYAWRAAPGRAPGSSAAASRARASE